jgi:hypothetical protein
LKAVNPDILQANNKILSQLNELEELRNQAYKNAQIYKDRTQKIHDQHLREQKDFKEGDQVLLYHSWLRLFTGKLKSRWTGPFIITKVFPYGTVEIRQDNGEPFKVNGHRLKAYEENITIDEEDVIVDHAEP